MSRLSSRSGLDAAVEPPGPTVRIARWSATHRTVAILLWLVFVATAVVAGNMAGSRQATDLDQATGEWGRAERIVAAGNFADPVIENVLITRSEGGPPGEEGNAAAREAADRLRALPEVASVEPPVAAPDGSALLVPVRMKASGSAADDDVAKLLAATAEVARVHPALRVEQVGGASLDSALDETLGKDFKRAELFSIPLTLLILLVAFGALLAAAVPLLLALSAVAAALGISALTSHLLPADDATNSVVLLIGLAVGVDYSLFYLRREREERAKGSDARAAIEIAAATSGHAVVVSGVAVVVAMAGLFLVGNPTFSSIGAGAMAVVLVSVMGSLTVLPALLATLGRWVDRPRVPLLWRLSRRRGASAGLWARILGPAVRRPALTLTVSAGLLLALALPALGMRLTLPNAADLPRSIPIMQSYDRLTAAYPSEGTTHLVAVQAPAEKRDAVSAALGELAARAAGDPLFAAGEELKIRTSDDGTVSTMQIPVRFDAADERSRDGYELLRTTLVPATVGALPDVQVAVGGETSGDIAFSEQVSRALPLVVGFVLLLTFLILALTFRSLVVAATAIVLNALSAGAAFGLLVLVFQHSWAEGLLGFRSNGGIVAWLPLLLFVILTGLSMDYHVFVVSRIREAAMRGLSTPDAVREGITSSAGVVTSAAAVMVAVFSVFATLSTVDMKQIGVGLAAAILIDATVVRAVVLPAAMTLLGRWNWWAPKFLRAGPSATSADGVVGESLVPART